MAITDAIETKTHTIYVKDKEGYLEEAFGILCGSATTHIVGVYYDASLHHWSVCLRIGGTPADVNIAESAVRVLDAKGFLDHKYEIPS